MLKLKAGEEKEERILGDIESSLRRFLHEAPKVNFVGCQFGLSLAARAARDLLDVVRNLRMTIFGETPEEEGECSRN
jgi:hypothetical protein